MFTTSGSQGHAKGVPDGGVHRRAHLGRGIGWMTALLLTSTPSWGQYLIDYPNGSLTLQQVINMAATDPGADGVRVLASNTSDLVVPPTFFDHVVSGPEAFSGRRIVVTTDGQGQPYRLARRLSVQTNLSYPGELRVEGGWLGNDWDMGVPYDGLAVCDIQQAAVSFFGTQFKRYQLQNGDWEEDCDLENRGPLVQVNGMQPLEDSGNETFSDFHYDVSRSVDFVDCVFQPQVDVTPSGCTEVEFPDPLIHATGARIRVLRPAFEILGYGSSYDFQLAPVFGANSMIHIEDSILDGVMGMEAGFVQASACPSFSSPQGTVPGLFLNDVEMSNGVGIKAGAVSIEGVTLARLVDCLFEDNTATGTSAGVFNTGAVRLLSCDEAEVLDCVFTGNEGDASGALTTKRGVSTPSFNRPKLKIHESTGGETRFSGNLGRNGAGALYVYSTKDILIKGVEFSGNGVLSPGNALTAATAVNVRWSGRTTSYTDPEIGLIKCLVNGNTPSEGESTGAVRFEACPAYVKDCEFSGDNGTIALRVAVTGTDVNAALIEDNRFVDQDVAIDLFLRRSATATTASYIRNNVFANSEHFGLFLRVDASGSEENAMLLVDGNTFRDTENLSIFFGEPLMRKVHLRNNLFWRETPFVEVDAHPSAVLSNVTLSHANLRGGTAALDLTGATIDAGTVYNLDPMFTTDHQLRWNSPMMDKGMGTGTGSQELLDFDFDLTNRDIGYHKTKDIVTVTGMQFGAGDKWYKASGNTSFMCSNASIPAGAVIRAETDADVTIETSSNQDLTIGSATGPRTSIVGRPSQTGTPADLIQFVGNGTGTSLLSLYGVLFNYVPDLPNAEDALEFVNMNVVDLSGNPQSNDCTVQFHNYGTSSLIFTNSKGTIRDLDFKATLTDPHLPDRIGQVASAVNVENIVFKPAGSQTSPFALKFVSPVSGGGTAVVKGCSFETNGDWADNYPVQVQQGAVRFEDNTFACDHQPGLYQLQSAVYMNDHAGNDFTVDDQQSFEAIEMDSGYLNLYCGGNHFIWGDPEDPIITYNTNNPMPALVPEWSWNWWGSSCTQGYDMSDYPDAVPAFGWITSPLDNCTQVPPTSCETLLSDTEWLLSHGKDAEEAEYWNVAHNYYRSILLDYPSSKDVPEATGRLKTVGQKGDYGLDYYEYVREDLLDASILSESLSYHVNAVQQECDAWLVEAYNGDCSVTISKLEDLANSETDPTCLAIIGAAQTELKYYSNCDGLLDAAPSGGPSVNVARATARRAMLFGTPEVRGAQEEQASSRPQGISIVSCHPNPFNPVTTIRFQLDEPAQAMVRVFNVKGQEVATLLNGLMSAGSHSVKFGGEGLASGLYLIQVETAGARDVQKVMLVK